MFKAFRDVLRRTISTGFFVFFSWESRGCVINLCSCARSRMHAHLLAQRAAVHHTRLAHELRMRIAHRDLASGAVLNDPHGGSGARDDNAGDHVSPQRSCAAPDTLVAPGASSCTVTCSMLRERAPVRSNLGLIMRSASPPSSRGCDHDRRKMHPKNAPIRTNAHSRDRGKPIIRDHQIRALQQAPHRKHRRMGGYPRTFTPSA